jgi:pimeloyl-ACP methyl ester carboxylesterase
MVTGVPVAAHRWTTVLGRRVHLVAMGEGVPLLFLHGLGASWVTWGPVLPLVTPYCQAVAPDLPGHGDSDPLHPYTLEQASPWVEALLDALGLGRVALVGNSLGGLVALAFALERPHRVSHLVLVDAAGLGRQVSWVLRLATLPLLGEVLEAPSPRGTERLLRRLIFADPRHVTPALVTELTRVRSRPGAKETVLAALRHGVGLLGVKGRVLLGRRLGGVRCPLLVVWGEKDRVFPVRQALQVRRSAPHARVVVFPRCGHWPHYEDPDAFVRLLLEFVGAPAEKGR